MDRQGRICSVEGCGRPYYAKGFCASHYQRNRLQALKRRRLERSDNRQGTTEPEIVPAKSCAAWLCGQPVYGMGLCRHHYENWNMDRFGVQMSGGERESGGS